MDDKRVVSYSGRNISISECKKICRHIATSIHIEEIRFSDCRLSDDIVRRIIKSAASNRSIEVIDFNGNYFRVESADQLCELLKQTKMLKKLYLQWNALGLHEDGMLAISKGLALNKSVEVLDLSNNQICHTGGRLIARALRKNKTLQSLDLQWNDIGVAGGREILSALQDNATLTDIQLAGNSIPKEILEAIATSIRRNAEYNSGYYDSAYQPQLSLARTLKHEIGDIHRLQQEKTLHLTSLATELQREKEHHDSFAKTTKQRLEELRESLNNVVCEKDGITKAKIQLQSDLTSAKMKINNLEESVVDLSKTNEGLQRRHLDDVEMFRETLDKEREQRQMELSDKNEQLSALQEKLRLLQEQLDSYIKEIHNVKSILMRKEEEGIVEAENYHREKELMKREHADQVKSLTNANMRYLKEKEDLGVEIIKLKSLNIDSKLKYDEEIVSERNKWKKEEEFKIKQHQTRYDVLFASKDELQVRLALLMKQEADAQAKILAHQSEIENYKQLFAKHKNSASQREQEHRNELSKLHVDIDNDRRECSDLRSKLDQSDKKCTDLRLKLDQLRSSKASEISAKENVIASLKDNIKNKEDLLMRNRQDELNRAGILEAALQTYILGSRSNKR